MGALAGLLLMAAGFVPEAGAISFTYTLKLHVVWSYLRFIRSMGTIQYDQNVDNGR